MQKFLLKQKPFLREKTVDEDGDGRIKANLGTKTDTAQRQSHILVWKRHFRTCYL